MNTLCRLPRRAGASGRCLLAGSGLWLVGCATIGASPGDRLLRAGDYPAAAAAYREAELRLPEDVHIKRNLGIALFGSDSLEAARAKLEELTAQHPHDVTALYFLARTYDETGNIDAALLSYGACSETGSAYRKAVSGRVRDLTRQRAVVEARQALERERGLGLPVPSESTLAVPDFATTVERSDLQALCRGLAAAMISDLSRVRQFRLIERARIRVLLDELNLAGSAPVDPAPTWRPIENIEGLKERLQALPRPGPEAPYYAGKIDARNTDALRQAVRDFQKDAGLVADGIAGPRTFRALAEAAEAWKARAFPPVPAAARVDPATAPRLGRLLGARTLVRGLIVPVGERRIQLAADLVDAASIAARSVGPPVNGPLESILSLEKQLVYLTLDALGVEPTRKERGEIDRLPTRSFEAFLAFSRGLALEDAGDAPGALEAYRSALATDPAFAAARASEASVGGTEDDVREAEQSATDEATKSPEPATGDDMVKVIVVSVGDGPSPDDQTGTDELIGDDPGDGADVTPIDGTKVSPEEGTIPTFPPPPGGSHR